MPAPAYAPGTILGGYRLIAPDSARPGLCWKAESLESAREISLRIFPRSIPPDPARRDALLQALRTRLPLEHPSIVAIRAASVHDDTLLIETDLVTGTSLAATSSPLQESEVGSFMASIAAALDALHSKGIIHGTLSPARVVRSGERWMIAEVNPSALLGRPDRGEERLLSATDPGSAEELRWRAPEQLARHPLDRRADVFSLGSLAYRAATGRDPFPGSTPEEAATAVLKHSPAPPHEINASLSQPATIMIGRCLHKDPTKRFASAANVLDELAKSDPRARSYAAPIVSSSARETVFLIAQLPYGDLLERSHPQKALRSSARMQQFIGESVLLFDGEVLDSLGTRLLATLPSSQAALSAAEHAKAAIADHNGQASDDDVIEPSILVHRGTLTIEGTKAGGSELDVARRVLPSLEPGQVLISGPVMRETTLKGTGSAAGVIEGIEFFALAPPQPAVVEAAEQPPALQTEDPSPPQSVSRRKTTAMWAAAALVVVVIAVAAVAMFMLRAEPGEANTPLADVSAPVSTESDARPVIFLGSFGEEAADPAAILRASAIRAAVARVLAAEPGLRVAESSADGVREFGLRPAPDGSGGMLPFGGSSEGPRVEIENPGTAVREIATWIAQEAGADSLTSISENPQAVTHFVEAVARLNGGDRTAAVAELRRATALDPEFLAAQRLIFEIHSQAGELALAAPAAEAILRRQPGDHSLRTTLFNFYRESEAVPEALQHAIALAREDAASTEILSYLAHRALSAGDQRVFDSLRAQIERTAGASSPFHGGDFAAATGQFAVASQRYYEDEPEQPENPWLAFKIGRVAVIRRSTTVTEMEIEKLATLEPRYLHPLLQAYLAAERRDRAAAVAALDRAAANAGPDAAIHTASAEIWAILADHRQTLASLGRAVEAREPTLESILRNPLFSYLSDDRQFAALRERMLQYQEETRAALAPLR